MPQVPNKCLWYSFFIIFLLVFGKLLSATGKFWIGNYQNQPIELITTLNVDDYAGGSSGAPEVTVPEYPGTIPAVGSTFSFVGYTWLVAHKENGVAYCVTNLSIGYTQWSITEENTSYFGSNIQIECQKMAISTGIQYADYVLDVGAGKVFIPSYDQMLGEQYGFSWFNSNSRRVLKSNNGSIIYLTSTAYTLGTKGTRIQIVDFGGDIISDNALNSHSIRSCIAISY